MEGRHCWKKEAQGLQRGNGNYKQSLHRERVFSLSDPGTGVITKWFENYHLGYSNPVYILFGPR